MLRNWRNNLTEKVVAVLVATVMTLYVQAQLHPIIDREFSVAIQAVNRPSGLELDALPFPSITVVAKGSRETVEAISANHIRAVVDLSKMVAGTKRLPIKLTFPTSWKQEIELKAVPGEIEVNLYPRADRKMDVSIQLTGAPSPDQAMPEAWVEPSSVTISGWSEAVRKTAQVLVSFDVANLQSDLEMDLAPTCVDSKGEPLSRLQTNPQTVRLRVRMVPQPSSKIAPVSVQWRDAPPFPYRIVSTLVEPSQVRVRGEPNAVAKVLVVETMPVSLASLKTDATLTAPLVAPPGVQIEGRRSVTIRVRIATVEPPPEP